MVGKNDEQRLLATEDGGSPSIGSDTSAAVTSAAAAAYGTLNNSQAVFLSATPPAPGESTEAADLFTRKKNGAPASHAELLSVVPTDEEEQARRGLAKVVKGSDEPPSGTTLTFKGRSPKFVRFGVLLLITLLPFGAHFVQSYFSSLETYFLEDPNLHFNETKYGSLMSAIAVPNLFMPFLGGVFLDSKGHNTGIVLFLTLELLGHLFFTVAMGFDRFWLAIAGNVLHGFGSGSVAVAMRTIVSQFFLQNELTFAHGVTIAGACISKTLAKASVAPIAETKWGYMGALWYVGLWQVVSLLAGVVYVRISPSARGFVGMDQEEVEHRARRKPSMLVALKHSTVSFWLVAILNTLLKMVHHLFLNYSGHFLVENYNVSPVVAGYQSALMPLAMAINAPIAGLILDRWGRRLYVLVLTNIVTIVAYALLLQDRVGGVSYLLVMLALSESFVPTILLSSLPLTVHTSVYGAAFGIAEVLSAAATIVANVSYGYSRDQTASYKQDLVSLIVMCFVCLALTLFLLFWDAWRGRSLLNRGGGVTPADV